MASNLIRFTLLLATLCAICAAQDGGYPCQAPAEIQTLSLDQVRSRLNARQSDFFLYQRLLDLTPDIPKPGTLAPEFAQKLREHSGDAQMSYLYGRSLI